MRLITRLRAAFPSNPTPLGKDVGDLTCPLIRYPTGLSPTLVHRSRWTWVRRMIMVDPPHQNHNSVGPLRPTDYSVRALPVSLAATRGIPVGFFSSAD